MLLLMLQETVTVVTSNVEDLLVALNPLVVSGVTYLVRKFIPNAPGWVIVVIIVPLLSAAAALLEQVTIGSGTPFTTQFIVGLAGVFIREAQKQVKQGNSPVTLQ